MTSDTYDTDAQADDRPGSSPCMGPEQVAIAAGQPGGMFGGTPRSDFCRPSPGVANASTKFSNFLKNQAARREAARREAARQTGASGQPEKDSPPGTHADVNPSRRASAPKPAESPLITNRADAPEEEPS